MENKKYFGHFIKPGFTLAESMVVLIVFGVIAVLIIPQLIKRQIEIANRAKLKKTMTAYDYLINKMIMKNDLRSNKDLENWSKDCNNSA